MHAAVQGRLPRGPETRHAPPRPARPAPPGPSRGMRDSLISPQQQRQQQQHLLLCVIIIIIIIVCTHPGPITWT